MADIPCRCNHEHMHQDAEVTLAKYAEWVARQRAQMDLLASLGFPHPPLHIYRG